MLESLYLLSILAVVCLAVVVWLGYVAPGRTTRLSERNIARNIAHATKMGFIGFSVTTHSNATVKG